MIKCLESGNWRVPDSLHDERMTDNFHKLLKVKDGLSVTGDHLVLRGGCFVIPGPLQARVIDFAHEGNPHPHLPKLDKLCEETVRKCFKCQIATEVKTRDPLQMTVLPSGPWESISIDFCRGGRKICHGAH